MLNLNKLILFQIIYLTQNYCFQTDWELNQLNYNFENEFIENPIFNTTEEAIKDARNQTNIWMDKNRVPGVVIGLSIKDNTVWTEGFGYTDVENNVKTDKNSVWRLASISKTLTSALVGQFLEKKLVDLDNDIHEYIPKTLYPFKTFDGKAVNITLRELLSHTAGLHLTDVKKDFRYVYKASNVSQTIEMFKNEKLLFRPGMEFDYSNYGFQLVGAIIESVLKNTYQNEIQKMCTKLQMNSTFAETREKIFKHRPSYYQLSNWISGDLQNTDIVDILVSYEGLWSAGGIVSTVDDLIKFGNAMLSSYRGENPKFLSESTVKELWSPETVNKTKHDMPPNNEYAKGWFITNIKQTNPYPYKTLVWHSGGLIGTSTMLFLFPEQDMVAVALSNRGAAFGLDQLTLRVAQNFQKFV